MSVSHMQAAEHARERKKKIQFIFYPTMMPDIGLDYFLGRGAICDGRLERVWMIMKTQREQ